MVCPMESTDHYTLLAYARAELKLLHEAVCSPSPLPRRFTVEYPKASSQSINNLEAHTTRKYSTPSESLIAE
jgi:hypothetical protein